MDFTTPRAALLAARLNELLEPLQVAFDAPTDEAQLIANVLDDAFRIIVQLEGHSGLVATQGLEGDDTGVLGARGAVPGDALVGRLLGNRGIPFFLLTRDVGDPVEALVIKLLH